MNRSSKLARIATLASSLTLLAGYVVYSHITPNTPPPDPLGVNTIELEMDAEAVEFDSFVKDNGSRSSSERPRNDLRIISSKVINQPIFHVRKREADAPEFRATTADFKVPGFQMVKDLEVMPGIVTSLADHTDEDRNNLSNAPALDCEKIMSARRTFSPNVDWDAVLEPFEQTKYFCSLHDSGTLSIYNVPNKGWLAKYKRHLGDLFREFTRSVDGCSLSSEVLMPFPEMVDWRSPEPSFEERLDDVFDGKGFHRPFESWSRYFQRFPFP